MAADIPWLKNKFYSRTTFQQNELKSWTQRKSIFNPTALNARVEIGKTFNGRLRVKDGFNNWETT